MVTFLNFLSLSWRIDARSNFTTPDFYSLPQRRLDIVRTTLKYRMFYRIRLTLVAFGNFQVLFSEEMLFSQGIRAGEFALSAQDARRANGDLHETSAPDQALRTLENLDLALKTADWISATLSVS